MRKAASTVRRFKRRPRVLYALAAVVVAASAYLSFELGRYRAGYSLLDHDRDVKRLRKTLAAERADLDEAQRQVAILKTSHEVDQATNARVQETLTQLEAKLQAQQEELEFYRGIVSPSKGGADLRVQSLQIRPGGSERRYFLELVLMQAMARDRRVEGAVKLKIAGTRDGKALELALKDVAVDDHTDELPYAFRYFQALEQEVELPVGFMPDTVQVQIAPSAPHRDATTQEFRWSAVTVE